MKASIFDLVSILTPPSLDSSWVASKPPSQDEILLGLQLQTQQCSLFDGAFGV